MSFESYIRLYQELLTMIDPENEMSIGYALNIFAIGERSYPEPAQRTRPHRPVRCGFLFGVNGDGRAGSHTGRDRQL